MIVLVPCGGLGNLLFQHAAAWSFAPDHEFAALAYYPEFRPKFGDYPRLFRHVKMLGTPVDSLKAPQFDLDPDYFRILRAVHLSGERAVFKENGGPIPGEARVLQGYFQSWKYFHDSRIEIRDLLRSNESELWEAQRARFSGGVCVHVRWGGDGLSQFTIGQPACTFDYYKTAMDLFPGQKFLVFCEEPELVKDFAGPNVEIITESDPLKTFFLMSLCDHFIIANSTLSLMAYYMRENEDAQLVAPRQWSRDANFKIDDLIKPSPYIKFLNI